ncbi:HupE/UreJ family protein [Variovorax saccharolyticus]|uniref:HupE/UreJ family protein n=1 Tax=Variovorax saccharolyticus TaxID=3053516 RepID=UPI0025755CAC|nr:MULTISPECIES: HupE/UreJ family protein [unclassified Variovorax]MDM0022486.1 HupE/UreJ family protein [Variovorax sp. J22R187]MDM0028250.1 HupE/UreJ family protein [Variovorax sp. J31P216]
MLHGFGFAALCEIGLPRGAIPLALLAFNVGVEFGQLAFIGAVLGTLWSAGRLGMSAPVGRRVAQCVPYGIGALSGFWFVGRVAAFWVEMPTRGRCAYLAP